MTITITVSAGKLSDFRAGILAARPIPLDRMTGEPQFTEVGWFKRIVRGLIFEVYEEGRREIAEAAAPEPVVDDDVLNVVIT